jgi:hypothetical protein
VAIRTYIFMAIWYIFPFWYVVPKNMATLNLNESKKLNAIELQDQAIFSKSTVFDF